MKRIAIIGTGMAGLSAAHTLKDHAEITLFDKARRVGGRLATRDVAPYQFDHGANFFYVKNPIFKAWTQPLIDKGILQPCEGTFAEFDGHQMVSKQPWHDARPRYVGVPEMIAMPEHLANNLTVYLKTTIEKVDRQKKWSLHDDKGTTYDGFDWVIITAPAAQTAALMPSSFNGYDLIQHTRMMACFTLMLGFKEALALPFSMAVIKNADISWMGLNHSKPNRDTPCSLTVNASNHWSDQHIDDDMDAIMQHLCNVTSHILRMDLSCATHQQLHRWKFANSVKQNPPLLLVDASQQLAACGDWCIEGRVEAAFLSGFETAKTILSILNKESPCSSKSP